MNIRKNVKLHEKVKPCQSTQNNAIECKIMAEMQIYPVFKPNNARMIQNSLFFGKKLPGLVMDIFLNLKIEVKLKV